MRLLLPLVLVAAAACSHGGHTLAYRKAVDTKHKAVSVLAIAGEPYARHADAMDDLIAEVDECYTQSRSHSDDRAAKQWLLVKNDVKRMAADWQQLDALQGANLEQRRKIILGDLDAIIASEAPRKAD